MKIILFAFLVLIFSNFASAAPELRSTISGFPKKMPSDGWLIYEVTRASDAQVTFGKRVKKRSRFTLPMPDESSIVSVSFFSLSKRVGLQGVSKPFGQGQSKKAGTAALKFKLTKMRMKSGALFERGYARMAAAASSIYVGTASQGFSAEGLPPYVGKGIADMVATDLVNSSCYDKGGGFAVVETSERFMKARAQEFNLCASGRMDPATCPQDRLATPTHFLQGSVTSDGSSITVHTQVVDQNGNVVAGSEASGSVEDWANVEDRAGRELAEKMCDAKISITESSCNSVLLSPAPLCHTIEPSMTGTAKGPVGTKIQFNAPAGTAEVDCGGWTPNICSSVLQCCERTSESQPDEITFTEKFWTLQRMLLCAPQTMSPKFIVQLINKGEELEQSVTCP